MRNIRPKYKVRWQRGRNALRCMWKRTEQNRRKWKVKKTGRMVRKSRKVKRMTARNARSNSRRVGGGRTPRKGKLKRWRKKKRNGRKGRKRRYGGSYGSTVSTKRRARNLRKQTRRCLPSPMGGRSYHGLTAWVPLLGERATDERGKRGCRARALGPLRPSHAPKVQLSRGQTLNFVDFRKPQSLPLPLSLRSWGSKRAVPRDHVRGKWERRAEVRRWRAGRAHSRGASRERREKGAVRRLSPYQGATAHSDPLENTCYELHPGEGIQVQEMWWKTRKGERMGRQFGRHRRSLARKRNGRTGYSYFLVDYKTGVRRVKRRPRSGEVRRPNRMERRRWMF
jgi:hypothetical protein